MTYLANPLEIPGVCILLLEMGFSAYIPDTHLYFLPYSYLFSCSILIWGIGNQGSPNKI